VRRDPRQQRVRVGPGAQARNIGRVSYDPISRKLPAAAPVAVPELVAAFERFEGLSLTELQDAQAACEARFRAWAERPENAARPISEAPDYLDRIALDSILERRVWSE
jgi:hypothetical protein